MPHKYDLTKVKELARKDAMVMTMRNTYDWLVKEIEEKIVNAYIAGYKQAEEDIKTGA